MVTLPCLPDEPGPSDADGTAAPEHAAGRVRILVVDDNRDATKSLSMLLGMEGHEVSTARDGRTAVQTALAERPALVSWTSVSPASTGTRPAGPCGKVGSRTRSSWP